MVKLLPLVVLFVITHNLKGQETHVVSGGNASGSGGSASYSLGQLFYTEYKDQGGNTSAGIQQALEVFTLTDSDAIALTLETIAFPNPTPDYLNLILKNHGDRKLNYFMFDTAGRHILQDTVREDITVIDMNSLATGIYILKIYQHKKELKTFKIIKR
jgi:hypothetical protein